MTAPGARRITDDVADSASASAGSAPRPTVLLLTDDTNLAAARTSRHLALALHRIGYRAVVRDTRLVRWGAHAAEAQETERRKAFEIAVVAKWAKLVEDYGISLVLGFDLHWLISKHLFVDDPKVRQVHSFWTGPVSEQLSQTTAFALDAPQVIGADKVVHHCTSDSQAEALRALGVERIHRYTPGAPAEYLRVDAPCEIRDRLGFIGDPTEANAALVSRLAGHGLLDVHGSPEAWKSIGVDAQELPPFPQLPALYRRYPALLNDGSDAQLFESAACGRLSLQLTRPGLRDWFAEDEIALAADEQALESAVENILHDPDAALAAGQRARQRTERDHLWENRLEAALA